jgi:hypothetical protein
LTRYLLIVTCSGFSLSGPEVGAGISLLEWIVMQKKASISMSRTCQDCHFLHCWLAWWSKCLFLAWLACVRLTTLIICGKSSGKKEGEEEEEEDW